MLRRIVGSILVTVGLVLGAIGWFLASFRHEGSGIWWQIVAIGAAFLLLAALVLLAGVAVLEWSHRRWRVVTAVAVLLLVSLLILLAAIWLA